MLCVCALARRSKAANNNKKKNTEQRHKLRSELGGIWGGKTTQIDLNIYRINNRDKVCVFFPTHTHSPLPFGQHLCFGNTFPLLFYLSQPLFYLKTKHLKFLQVIKLRFAQCCIFAFSTNRWQHNGVVQMQRVPCTTHHQLGANLHDFYQNYFAISINLLAQWPLPLLI